MIRVSKPAAMSGPTGTPRSKATPATVPTSKPATTSGWLDISFTPRPPSHATKTPMAIASNDLTLKKDLKILSPLILPLAIGTKTAMVKMMIPIFNPCCWMSGKYSLSGVIRKIMSTAAAMVTAEL